jgi:hypothetical protein
MESILKDSLCYLDTIPSIDWEDLAKLHHVNQSPNGHSSNKELQVTNLNAVHKGKGVLCRSKKRRMAALRLY